MKVPKVANALNYLDDDLISEAIEYKPKKKKPALVKWGVVAACFAIILSIGIPYTVQYLHNIQDSGGTGYVCATKMTFEAKIVEVQENAILVEPLEGTMERELSTSILIRTDNLAELSTIEYVVTARVGDIVQIGYLKEDTNISQGTIAVYEIVFINTETVQ